MFFKKNLALIEKKNPALAAKLAEIYLVQAEENIEVYEADSGGFIFAYDGLVLDDMIDPKAFAGENWTENVTDMGMENGVVIVYGLGTGYLLKLACQQKNFKILFYEPKIDILRYAIEFIDFEEEFAFENLTLLNSDAEVKNALKKVVKSKETKVAAVYPEAYMQLLPDELAALLSDITEIVENIV